MNSLGARAAIVASSLRRAISSTIDVIYTASVRLLSFDSRLERAPVKAACSNATASWTSADAAREVRPATVSACLNPRAQRRITSRGTSAAVRSANWIAACRSVRWASLACGMVRAAKSFTAVSVSIVSINCSCTSLSAFEASTSIVRSSMESDLVFGSAATLRSSELPIPPATAAAETAP
jgi:hypothetical protein